MSSLFVLAEDRVTSVKACCQSFAHLFVLPNYYNCPWIFSGCLKSYDKHFTIQSRLFVKAIVGALTPFQQYFSYIAAASAPTNAFLDFFVPVPRTTFCPSHWLISHITIAETTDSSERGMNPVAMAIIIPGKAGDRTSDLPFSSPKRYQLWGSVIFASDSIKTCDGQREITLAFHNTYFP